MARQRKGDIDKTMIEVKATTSADRRTEVDLKVNAELVEYGAEVLAIIQSLMGAVKNDDIRLHAAVIKAIADDPNILLGEDESEKAKVGLAQMMSKGILKGGMN